MKFLTMLLMLLSLLGCAERPRTAPTRGTTTRAMTAPHWTAHSTPGSPLFSEILFETLQRGHKRELTFNEVSARATAAAVTSMAETLDTTLRYLILLIFVLTGSAVLFVIHMPGDSDIRSITSAIESLRREK